MLLTAEKGQQRTLAVHAQRRWLKELPAQIARMRELLPAA
jgi:hypothetical protein